MLKKLIFVFAFLYLFSFYTFSVSEPAVSAEMFVLINAQTKEILCGRSADKKAPMASTTKIMTSLLAVESGKMSMTVEAENVQCEGTVIGLADGYRLSLEALVWGMLLESGNDAALATANYLSGSEESFLKLMNKKAQSIGMKNTSFASSSGLDAPEHYSTAYDMALLGAYAVSNPVFREMVSTKTKTVSFIEPSKEMVFYNHNKLLSLCEGAIGIKTGFTSKSGRCLVSACERDGAVLVAVTLNAGDDWNDHIKLYDYGFDITRKSEVFIRLPGKVKVISGEQGEVSVSLDKNPLILSSCKKMQLTQKIFLPRFIYAPVAEGQCIGYAELYDSDKLIYSAEITADNAVTAVKATENKTLFRKITEKIFNIAY